ncbi:NAD-dependent protein deacetylase [Janibacter anophelis]|uniref:NAD-dependent protein deacetylase n=1 Tax=Janibacter anophelis TaxID=319054 RepID=UPI000DEF1FC3|nr:NAD-dependent protein deacetylase [Janibacter anophelis]
MIEDIARVLSAGPALVLTGAGMSTASGIPDYRGPDGTRRVQPMDYSEFVGSSGARQRYWARSFVGWRRFSAARPNAAHHHVTRLQELGAVGRVITQNVDGLHQAAGTREVVELHGNLVEVVCLTCDARVDRPTLDARMAADNPGFDVDSDEIRPDGDVRLDSVDVERFRAPICQTCGADTLKPDVVFFGGSVAKPLVQRCYDLVDAAPSLLVLGSSLQVMSGLRFVRHAAKRGIPVALITRGPTRGDDLVDHRVDGELGDSLRSLVEAVTAGVTAARP